MPLFAPIMWDPHYLLEVDALLLTAAREHARRARVPKSKIEPLTRRLDRLQERMDELDPWEDGDEVESLAIQMEGTYGELAAAYTPVFRLCAQAHINAALAIEAHTNRKILRHLAKEPGIEGVLRMSPVEKVQELLERKGGGPLGKDESPLPKFQTLVKTRNALVHYRPRRLPVPATRLPTPPRKLGLEPGLAQRSVRTAEEVIKEVCHRLGERPPHWASGEAYSVFAFEMD